MSWPIHVVMTVCPKSRQQLRHNYVFELVGSDDLERLPQTIELTAKEWRFLRRFRRDEMKFAELCEQLRGRRKGIE